MPDGQTEHPPINQPRGQINQSGSQRGGGWLCLSSLLMMMACTVLVQLAGAGSCPRVSRTG